MTGNSTLKLSGTLAGNLSSIDNAATSTIQLGYEGKIDLKLKENPDNLVSKLQEYDVKVENIDEGDYKYHLTATGNHAFADDGKCTDCGKTKCEVENHHFVSGGCSVCSAKGCEIGQLDHDWVKGVCSVCNKQCDHVWNADTGVCEICQYECTHEGDKCDICGKVHDTSHYTASALSDGNMTIIIGFAALVVGLGGGFFLGRKKKSALESGANSEDEE